MRRLFNKCTRLWTGTLFLLVFSTHSFSSVFLKNESIVDERAVKQIEIMGKELHQKTGVTTHVVAIKSLDKVPLVTYEENLAKDLKPPFILLALSKNDQQVDIKASSDVLDKFDREGILSPYPLNGTILPILASKKGEDKYSAAILNGYADIVDQVADSYNIQLKSSIGSANKNVINVLKVIFYSFCAITIGIIIYFKRKRKRGRV